MATWVQVQVPQQPIDGEAGVNACGVLAPYYFRRFLMGVEEHVQPASTADDSPGTINTSAWLDQHMAAELHPVDMHHVRAASMRCMLEVMSCRGHGVNAHSIAKELQAAYGAG